MLETVTAQIKGVLATTAIILNTVVCGSTLYLVTAVRLLSPRRLRDHLRRLSAGIAEAWIGFNNLVLGCYRSLRWTLRVPATLDPDANYLINCNHQSWVDIVVLQRVFNRRTPLMRFFIKRELVWVPLLGIAWWALDFPFMRRHSRAQIERNPALRGKDLETTRRACERLQSIPVSLMSFMEGTRFSPRKQELQQSPYRHLLKPRVGGVGQVLYSFGDRIKSMIDVTIVYPGGAPTLWQLLTGRVEHILVHAREMPIPDCLRGRNFSIDREGRRELEAWARRLWEEKDRMLDELQDRPATTGAAA